MSWFWLVIILAGVIIDIGTSNFLFVSFSIGALASIIFSSLGLSVFWQFFSFAILSLACLLFIYPKVKKKIKDDNITLKTMEQNYIGRTMILPEDIDDSALIKYEGVFWTFKSNEGPIKKGEKIKIVNIEGNKLLINKETGV